MATNTTVVGTRVAKPKAASRSVARGGRPAVQEQAGGRRAWSSSSCFLFCGIFGPFIAPWPYQVQDLQAVFANGNRPLPPLSPNHILGHRPARS